MVLEGNWTECVRLEEKEVAFNASSGVPTKDAALSVSPDPILEVLLHTFFFLGGVYYAPKLTKANLPRTGGATFAMKWGGERMSGGALYFF